MLNQFLVIFLGEKNRKCATAQKTMWWKVIDPRRLWVVLFVPYVAQSIWPEGQVVVETMPSKDRMRRCGWLNTDRVRIVTGDAQGYQNKFLQKFFERKASVLYSACFVKTK
jgi:hypothetical protein